MIKSISFTIEEMLQYKPSFTKHNEATDAKTPRVPGSSKVKSHSLTKGGVHHPQIAPIDQDAAHAGLGPGAPMHSAFQSNPLTPSAAGGANGVRVGSGGSVSGSAARSG